jgi:hypothetical protein
MKAYMYWQLTFGAIKGGRGGGWGVMTLWGGCVLLGGHIRLKGRGAQRAQPLEGDWELATPRRRFPPPFAEGLVLFEEGEGFIQDEV